MPSKRLQQRILTRIAGKRYKPVKPPALARLLKIPSTQYEQFESAIDALHRSGRLMIGEGVLVSLPQPTGPIEGTYKGNVRGFGFVTPIGAGWHEDIFIPQGRNLTAITGDLVQVELVRRRMLGGRQQRRIFGQVVKILERKHSRFVGVLERSASHWLVHTDGRILHSPVIVDDHQVLQVVYCLYWT